MNYIKHYTLLIDRSKNRVIDDYTESHHIIPRCMGGTDDNFNLVKLTPEEHYVAHQLLIKIYPNEPKLVYAALMMCSSSKFTKRSNKLYGWLKRKYQIICKQRIGNKNGSFNTRWINNGYIACKIKVDVPLPDGYREGRSLKSHLKCITCGDSTDSIKAKYCNKHRNRRINTNPHEVLAMWESGVPLQEILNKYGWKLEQNLTGYLNINFPERKKFLPNQRIKCR